MIVELLVYDEVSKSVRPLRVQATQVVVRNATGTPILAVAADYGTSRSQIVAKATDQDFNESLSRLGLSETVRVDYLQTPGPAPGAKLIRSPKDKK